MARRQLAPGALNELLAATGKVGEARKLAGEALRKFPVPASAQMGQQPLEIDISGGRVGTPEELALQAIELEQLRAEAARRQRAAGY